MVLAKNNFGSGLISAMCRVAARLRPCCYDAQLRAQNLYSGEPTEISRAACQWRKSSKTSSSVLALPKGMVQLLSPKIYFSYFKILINLFKNTNTPTTMGYPLPPPFRCHQHHPNYLHRLPQFRNVYKVDCCLTCLCQKQNLSSTEKLEYLESICQVTRLDNKLQ